jgi:hypothetical protein
VFTDTESSPGLAEVDEPVAGLTDSQDAPSFVDVDACQPVAVADDESTWTFFAVLSPALNTAEDSDREICGTAPEVATVRAT